ncbi:hypothetical protein V9T40_001106 [Parthenolecanium corni]|uniref:CRAL-TRIO domain-containing protein n=1 Tax=Parthenolecanium corni TaxID=536013 RepID=A0AAN9TNM0_9HEMI
MQYFEKVSEEQLLDILKDVGTDEESIKRDVDQLKNWLEMTPYLPSVKDEVFLRSAILRCKNSMERAKRFLDYYYSRRTLGIDMFSCRDLHSEEIRNSKDFVASVPLPRLTREGYRIYIVSFRAYSAKDLPKVTSILSMWQMEQEVLMKSDTNKGIIGIIDAKYFGVSVAALFLTEIKKCFDLITKTTRTRYFETYIINILPAGQKFYDMTKHILSGKMLGRIKIWKKKPEELAEVLPKSILPLDFGGEERSIDELQDAWFEYMRQFDGWFESEKNFQAELNKRPRDDYISEEFFSFGLNGTFRQIILD